MESQMFERFGQVFSDKQMAMDFADLEDAGIQHQRKRAEENLYMFGNGLGQLVWGITGLVQATVSIAVSISLTVTLFTQTTGNAVLDSPLCIPALLTCIAWGGLCNARATARENDVFEAWCKGTVWFNRTFLFYGRELYMSPERAKDVRIYRQEGIADRAFAQLMQKEREDNRSILKMAAFPSIACAAIGVTQAVCCLFVVLKAYFGAFGVGSIVQYVGVLTRLSEGVRDMLFVLADNEVYCGHLQGLFDYLDIPNGKDQGALNVDRRAKCGGDGYILEFHDVSFKYPGAASYALRHVSLKLSAGKRLAVVGPNGSGKTTFIKLLCRLYDPDEGAILLNGIDIREYDYDDYMSIFSVVFQDFKLFSFSLAQNVAASTEYDASRVEACLREAGLGNRLQSMPEGIATCLYRDYDENGVEVSGGEAQKIAMARALYRRAPFIVLDEPTAALDPIAECETYTRFDAIVGDRTAVYISHRLASCRFCDAIAVFEGGRIVQQGGHEALLADVGGLYARLWHAQAQYYGEG